MPTPRRMNDLRLRVVVAVAITAALLLAFTIPDIARRVSSSAGPVGVTLAPDVRPATGSRSSSSAAPSRQTSRAPSTRPRKTTAEPKPTTTPKPKTVSGPTAAQRRTAARNDIGKIVSNEPSGGVSVAALNMSTGAGFSAGATSGMWTASCYKLLMLVTILLHGGTVGAVGSTAQAAIENSDNVAGYSLWQSAGGNAGEQAAIEQLGMTHTSPGGSDPTFTRTSAPDYLKLVKALVEPGLLPASQRSQVLYLMRNVEADQRWGVGAASETSDFENKNGWLSIDNDNGPGEDDGGLWAVNSVGIVTVHGQQVLMAVFTEHQPDMPTGVALDQQLARDLAAVVT